MDARQSGPVTRPTLLVRIKDSSDEEAWREFVGIYEPMLKYRCEHRLQHADAEVVVNDVLLTARQFEYDRQRGRFRSWLFTVLTNAIRRQGGREARRPDRGKGGPQSNEVLEGLADRQEEESWDQEFISFVLIKAAERIRSEYSPERWAGIEAVAFRIEETAAGKQFVLIDEAPRLLAERLGWTSAQVSKLRFLARGRLIQEVHYLTDNDDFKSLLA